MRVVAPFSLDNAFPALEGFPPAILDVVQLQPRDDAFGGESRFCSIRVAGINAVSPGARSSCVVW